MSAAAGAQTFSLRLEGPSGQSPFRIGEVVGLKLIVETAPGSEAPPANGRGWMITLYGHDRSVLGFGRDRFVVTPETGTRDPWNYRMHEGLAYSGPGGMRLGDKEAVLDVDLNQWVRIERPGHYTIRAVIHVMGPQNQDIELESNQIELDIAAADSQWQAQELANDVAVLQSTMSKIDNESFEARMSAARRITYLDTPAAVGEMARRLGTADIQTAQILADGLRSSRHGREAIIAMRELLRSPAAPVPPIFLRTLAALDKAGKDPRSALAEAIEQKQEAAKAISIKTLLDDMPAESVPVKLRSEIAALFTELPTSQQTELLNYQWKKIDGPEMVPALRQIYETAPQARYPEHPLLASAVERLYELDTNRTRALLLEEIKRSEPRLPYHTLAMLPEATLAELDATLLDHLQHNGGRPVEELIARYSTGAILDAVKDFYAKLDAEMRARDSRVAAPACAPALIACFLRVDPAWGEKILRQSLSERGYSMGRCWLGIIGQTAVYYSGPVWERVAIEALQDTAVPVKIDAVRALGQYGSAAAKPAILGAFRYWHEWWETRGEPNDENRRLEQAFVEATTRPKNWMPSDAELATVRDLCVTPSCKTQVRH